MAATDPRSIIARLAVAVMAADGRITAGELEVASHLDSLGLGDLSDPVRAEIQIAMRDPIDPVAVCGELTPLSREAAATIVAALAEIALADRMLSRRESQVLFLIARALGLHDSETEHLVRGSLVAHGAVLRPDADEQPPAATQPASAPPRPAATQPQQTPTRGTVPQPTPEAAAPPSPPPRAAAAPPPAVPRPIERPAAPARPEQPPQLHVREPRADGLDLDRARDMLGVGPHATREDVDAAYLRLVSFYDPAKVIDLGPEFVVLSVRRLGQATTAYQIAVNAAP